MVVVDLEAETVAALTVVISAVTVTMVVRVSWVVKKAVVGGDEEGECLGETGMMVVVYEGVLNLGDVLLLKAMVETLLLE